MVELNIYLHDNSILYIHTHKSYKKTERLINLFSVAQHHVRLLHLTLTQPGSSPWPYALLWFLKDTEEACRGHLNKQYFPPVLCLGSPFKSFSHSFCRFSKLSGLLDITAFSAQGLPLLSPKTSWISALCQAHLCISPPPQCAVEFVGELNAVWHDYLLFPPRAHTWDAFADHQFKNVVRDIVRGPLKGQMTVWTRSIFFHI